MQTVQKNLALMSFVPNLQQNSNRTFGKRQLIEIFLTTLYLCGIFVYMIHVANTTDKYLFSFFALIDGCSFALSQLSFMVKNDKIFQIIEFCENLIADSEFPAKSIWFDLIV